jgi:hypothetical protein
MYIRRLLIWSWIKLWASKLLSFGYCHPFISNLVVTINLLSLLLFFTVGITLLISIYKLLILITSFSVSLKSLTPRVTGTFAGNPVARMETGSSSRDGFRRSRNFIPLEAQLDIVCPHLTRNIENWTLVV